MKTIYNNAIDWMSIKLNAVCFLGFFTGSNLIATLSIIATVTTIIYNAIRIFKEIKNKND
jgi:hypothetical protein